MLILQFCSSNFTFQARNPPVMQEIQRLGFDPWVWKNPGKGNGISVFLPGKSHGQRSLVGYSPWGYWVGHDWGTGIRYYTQELDIIIVFWSNGIFCWRLTFCWFKKKSSLDYSWGGGEVNLKKQVSDLKRNLGSSFIRALQLDAYQITKAVFICFSKEDKSKLQQHLASPFD